MTDSASRCQASTYAASPLSEKFGLKASRRWPRAAGPAPSQAPQIGITRPNKKSYLTFYLAFDTTFFKKMNLNNK